jgi:TRAP-type C4-dicarboxylate transport system permease small subunit
VTNHPSPADRAPAAPEPRVPLVTADLEPAPEATRGTSRLARAMLAIGSAGLLGAMATDALAVAGRHAGIRLFGAIEIVQACIVLVATSAILLTTIVDGHARVHILLERLQAAASTRLLRGADAVSALIFLWFALGSAWLLADLWSAFELTEILHIPLRWLRAAWIAGAIATALIFAGRALRGARS